MVTARNSSYFRQDGGTGAPHSKEELTVEERRAAAFMNALQPEATPGEQQEQHARSTVANRLNSLYEQAERNAEMSLAEDTVKTVIESRNDDFFASLKPTDNEGASRSAKRSPRRNRRAVQSDKENPAPPGDWPVLLEQVDIQVNPLATPIGAPPRPHGLASKGAMSKGSLVIPRLRLDKLTSGSKSRAAATARRAHDSPRNQSITAVQTHRGVPPDRIVAVEGDVHSTRSRSPRGATPRSTPRSTGGPRGPRAKSNAKSNAKGKGKNQPQIAVISL